MNKTSFHLKPDLEITKKIIDRDFHILFIFLTSVIALAVYSFIQDWNYKPVFVIMATVAFLFMGQKKDFPNESWSPQQKGAWTKRYTTLKLNKDNNIVYISGDRPYERESFALEDFKNISSRKKKIVIEFNDSSLRKISTMYWSQEDVESFVEYVAKKIKKT